MKKFEMKQISWDNGKTWIKPYRFKDISDIDKNGYKFIENLHESDIALYKTAIKLSKDDMIIKNELNGFLSGDILYNTDSYKSVWININSINYDEYGDYTAFRKILDNLKN
jgi:hypothetical protein